MLKALKEYLRIIGDDEDTALNNTISRGKARLEELAGIALDFDKEGAARSLLFDFCRYAYNNASEYFEENFSQEILRLQLQSAVSENENKS